MADNRTMGNAPTTHRGFHKEIDEAFYEHGDRFIDLLSGNAASWNDRECLKIIESKSKVRQSRSKAIVAKVSTSSSTPGVSPDVAELKDMVKALLLDKKNQSQAPATVKAVEESCVTCGGLLYSQRKLSRHRWQRLS
ncbi:hypothetical protein Tco_0427934 [Tanacetum coccineum]